ncbi:MAG TPA: redoxin domain-containing protein [Pirellulales bacterium]|nr:redoxin domain-containing protein [Pirellulales bacterium]
MKYVHDWAILAACLVLAIGGPRTLAEENQPAKTPLGKRVQSFDLRDFRGKHYSLDDFQESRALVVAYLGTECPLALQYAPRLAQLSDRFSERGVAFIGVNSNQQDSISELAAYAKIHEIKFPLLKDVGNLVADQMGAVRTPEVFLLDRDRVVRYWGRIDDQYVPGRQRKQATREDLAVALEELLAGNPISQPATDVQGCRIGRVHQSKSDAPVTYSKHIAPLLNSRCVECHRAGEIAPFSLTSYAEVAGWAETMLEVVGQNRMPPWHASPEFGRFSNDRGLSDAEKQLLAAWVEAGAPEGDPKDLPAPPQFAEGWRLPRVDREIFMSETSFDVPAEGMVNYKYFAVDPGFKEDKWVQGAEVRPGNRAVVHHIILTAREGSHKRGRGEGRFESEYLAATAPGAQPMMLADGMAKLVPAGSKLVFQVHYTPNGSPQKDRSSVGLMFVDADKVRKQVATLAVETQLLLIPPLVSDYQIQAWRTFQQDTLLLSLFPHMHLRGKAFRYEAQYPDGTKEVLLDVPRYDFAWQQTYELAAPKLLPKGTKMRCIARYDNSPENLGNPNPKAVVHWGEQTWDEMLMGFLDMTTPDDSEPSKKPDADAVLSNPGRPAQPDETLPGVR